MKNIIKRIKKNERGLTLVELLAVIVILAIVGAIAFVAIGNVIENSRKDAHVANAQQLISAAKIAEVQQGWPQGGFHTSTAAATPGPRLETIDELINPWNAEDSSYYGIVQKDGNEYKVTINGDKINLTIYEVPESIIDQGRDAVENHNQN